MNEPDQLLQLRAALQPDFQVHQLVGRGGYADVFSATDVNLKRLVAIKVLRWDWSSSRDAASRFRREASAIAQIRHPNVIPIYQVGVRAGISFFVMPLISGGTLRSRMDSGPLSLNEARRLLGGVASALQAAHRAGIVHRDVKPENVLLDGPGANPIVTDFGIAKAIGAGDGVSTTRGVSVGTPRYMSPEQADARADIDSRTDIYSLGVLAYELLMDGSAVGDRGFPGLGSRLQGAITEQTFRGDVPRELCLVVLKCLEPERSQRWQSAGALADAFGGTDHPTRVGGIDAPESARMVGARQSLSKKVLFSAVTAAALLVVLVKSGMIGERSSGTPSASGASPSSAPQVHVSIALFTNGSLGRFASELTPLRFAIADAISSRLSRSESRPTVIVEIAGTDSIQSVSDRSRASTANSLVIDGGFVGDASGRLRIDARLLDPRSGAVLASHQSVGNQDGVMTILADLADGVSCELARVRPGTARCIPGATPKGPGERRASMAAFLQLSRALEAIAAHDSARVADLERLLPPSLGIPRAREIRDSILLARQRSP
jgi:serine/threonine protein kinase